MNRKIEKAFNLFAVNHPHKRVVATSAGVNGGLIAGIIMLPLDGGLTVAMTLVVAGLGGGGSMGVLSNSSNAEMNEGSAHYIFTGNYNILHDGKNYTVNSAQRAKYQELQKKIEDVQSRFKKSESVSEKKKLNKKSQKYFRFQTDIVEYAQATRAKAAEAARKKQHALDAIEFNPKGNSGKGVTPN